MREREIRYGLSLLSDRVIQYSLSGYGPAAGWCARIAVGLAQKNNGCRHLTAATSACTSPHWVRKKPSAAMPWRCVFKSPQFKVGDQESRVV